MQITEKYVSMHVCSSEVHKEQEGERIKCFISLYNLKSEWFHFYYTLQIGSWSALWCDDFNTIIIISAMYVCV